MEIKDLREFALIEGVELTAQKEIIREAALIIAESYAFDQEQLKVNFDILLDETERETHQVYKKHEQVYSERVLEVFVSHLISTGQLRDIAEAGKILGSYNILLDKFYLSLANGRKARAGNSFENIQNSLFMQLGYPFSEQPVINGKPDFIMPSKEHYFKNAMDCIIYTSKRTLRERWRQIVTEGTRGLGFFLATIDEGISSQQLDEMLKNRVYIVCPERIRMAKYTEAENVMSFSQFFRDYVDPAMARWKRNGII